MENVPDRKISKIEEEWAANIIRKYTTSDPIWPSELVRTKKIGQKRSEDPSVPDEIDFKTTYSGSDHNKGFTQAYIIRIRKNEEGKIEFCSVTKGFDHDRETTLYGMDKFLKANITENISKLTISKEEEGMFLQLLIKSFSDKMVGKTIRKVKHERNDSNVLIRDKIYYSAMYSNGTKILLKVIKNSNGKPCYYPLDLNTYSHQTIHPIPLLTESYIDPSSNTDELKYYVTKMEEEYALQWIKRKFLPKLIEDYNKNLVERNLNIKYTMVYSGLLPEIENPEAVIKGIQKINVKTDKDSNLRSIVYFAKDGKHGAEFLFRIAKASPHIVSVNYLDPFKTGYMEYELKPGGYPGNSFSFDNLKENTENILNLSISKEEEQRAFEVLRNMVIHKPSGYLERLGKTLKKVEHKKSRIPQISDTIEYKDSDNPSFTYVVRKDDSGVLHLTYRVQDAGSTYEEMGGRHYIFENITKPNLKISKEEEEKAFRFLSRRKDFSGDQMIMRKVGHQRSNDPNVSDKIKYTSPTNTDIVYYVIKDEGGNLVYGLSIPEDNYISVVTIPIPLNENYPSGNWRGWEDITQPEKDRLKLVLKELQEYYKKYYHMNISSSYVFLIQKCIDNLDVTDPRDAARPLSKLSMEHRLFMGDFVDQKDTTGQSSKVMDFLMGISRQYIEPPTPPTPDIELKGITNIVYPAGYSKGDVFISGLEDMRPVINFGYGPYTLDDRFIKEYSKPNSQLYLDFGQRIKVVNMSEVMIKVKDAIEKHKKSLMESKFSNSPAYEEAILTKEDEGRGFQFISIFLLPEAVNLWNSGIKSPEDDDLKITEEEVRRNIRKKICNVHDNVTGNYYTTYQLMLFKNIKKLPVLINFFVEKNKQGQLFAKYSSIKGKTGSYPIKENIEQTSVILSKEDEAISVQFLRNMTIDDERIGKTLRKFRVEKTDSPNISDKACYMAMIGEETYIFKIYRSLRRGLIVFDETNYVNYFPLDGDIGYLK